VILATSTAACSNHTKSFVCSVVYNGRVIGEDFMIFRKSFAAVVPALVAFCFSACGGAGAVTYVEKLPQTQLLHDGKLHVFLLGTGSPEVEMQNVRKPACLAIIADGQVLLFDAGEGAMQTMAGLGLPYELISNVFMTHWHSDHFGGLGQVMNDTWLHGRNVPLNIWGPYGTKQVIEGLNKAYALDAVFRTATMPPGVLNPEIAGAVPHEVEGSTGAVPVYSSGAIKVSAFLVDHAPVVPAFGYVITYHGAKIVISGDTCIFKSLEEQSKAADILVSEAYSHAINTEEMAADKVVGDDARVAVLKDLSKYHADTLDLAKMAQRAGVKHLFITHLVPPVDTTSEAKQHFIEGMSDFYKSEIVVTDDGDQIELTPVDSGNTGTAGACSVHYLPQEQPVRHLVPRPAGGPPTG
jgi:ribonuclease Z